MFVIEKGFKNLDDQLNHNTSEIIKSYDFKGKTIYMGLNVDLKSWDLKVLTKQTTPGETLL